MSILIKGIEKPKNGGFIEIRLYDNRAECEIQEHVYADFEIKEVPTPHGRLIDCDAIVVNKKDYYIADDFMEAINMLADAPTVIESEE